MGFTQVPDDSSWRPVKIGWLKFSGFRKPLPETLDAVTLRLGRCVRQLVSEKQKKKTIYIYIVQASEGILVLHLLSAWRFLREKDKSQKLVLFPEGLSMVLKSEDGVGE